MEIKSEHLALWFLRLNGFLTIPNFVVHPEGPREDGCFPQETDVDVLGVRFPWRSENRHRPMPDHEFVSVDTDRIQVVITEVKAGQCNLNGPWTKRERENLQKVLSAGGFRPVGDVDQIAASLYETGQWADSELAIRLVCFGAKHNRERGREFPAVPQLLWSKDVLPFIYKRFRDYHLEKKIHHQWDEPIKELFKIAQDSTTPDEFMAKVKIT